MVQYASLPLVDLPLSMEQVWRPLTRCQEDDFRFSACLNSKKLFTKQSLTQQVNVFSKFKNDVRYFLAPSLFSEDRKIRCGRRYIVRQMKAVQNAFNLDINKKSDRLLTCRISKQNCGRLLRPVKFLFFM